jgi:hypothetical protein
MGTRIRRDAGPRAVGPAGPVRHKPKATKVGIYLPRDARERLAHHVTRTGDCASAIVERLIMDHLPHYVLSVRGEPSGGAGQG